MDKKAWIAVTLSVIGIFAWNYFYTRQFADQPVVPARTPAAPPAAVSDAAPVLAAVVPPPVVAAPAPPPVAPAAPVEASAESATESFETIKTSVADLRFTNLGGGITNTRLLDDQHRDAKGGQIQINQFGGLPIGSLSEKPGDVKDASVPYESTREGSALVYRRNTREGLQIVKKFQPAAGATTDPYLTQLEITFTNGGAQTYRDEGLFLNAGSATPIHTSDQTSYTGFDWYRAGKMLDKDVNYFEAGKIPLIGYETSPAKAMLLEPVDTVGWVAVKNQFYTTVLSPVTPKPADDLPAKAVWANRFRITPPNGTDASAIVWGIAGAIGLPPLKLEPGESRTLTFTIYAGPREYDRLKTLGHGQEEIMNFGWFKFFSVMLLSAMKLLKGWLGSYALAIVVLTVGIKALLWPLQARAIKVQKQMSLLAPKMKELQEKYKEDPARMQREVMSMQRDYGVSPLGGCLPMLAQMPIFIGFYSMLGTAVELRNSGFLWVHDLTQPDTIAALFGIPINPLPLLMTATMFWQMAITPKTGDPQQQRMFMFMPLIFIFFCYNFASGLALYMTVQNLLSVLQTYYTRKQPLPALVRKSTAAGPEKPANARVLGAGGKKKALR